MTTISIHVSDRTLSRMQYEDSFRNIRNFIRQKMEKVPKRRWNTIAKPLLQAVNDAFEAIMSIEEDPVTGTKTAAQTRYDRILEAQKRIKAIEKPLWVYWNICADEEESGLKYWKVKAKANLCDFLNEKVLIQLHDMQMHNTKYVPEQDKGLTQMRYYTEAEIEKAEFLTKLRDLHRMTHGKVLRLNMVARDADGELLLRFIDQAWCYAVYGNQLRLDIPEERNRRKRMFSLAISALYKAQRPLFNLFSIGSYSNREMRDWTHLLNESTRLLLAVQSSDSKRAA